MLMPCSMSVGISAFAIFWFSSAGDSPISSNKYLIAFKSASPTAFAMSFFIMASFTMCFRPLSSVVSAFNAAMANSLAVFTSSFFCLLDSAESLASSCALSVLMRLPFCVKFCSFAIILPQILFYP